jgi:hypothetical protein
MLQATVSIVLSSDWNSPALPRSSARVGTCEETVALQTLFNVALAVALCLQTLFEAALTVALCCGGE